MTNKQLPSVLQQIRRVVRDRAGALPDADLLERFLSHRDSAAFEVLLWRHGPMVLSLCRRLLRHDHDAEDAFQATFLILVRQAASISKKESLAAWLYKVAYRTAVRARGRNRRLGCDTQATANIPAVDNANDAARREFDAKLDDAVQQLPPRYRVAIILCCFEGKSYREAAEQLGCPISTLSTRLMRARQLLRKRLNRYGFTLPATLVTAFLRKDASSAPPTTALVDATLRSAVCLAAGQTGGAIGLSPGALGLLVEGAAASMRRKMQAAMVFVCTTAIIAGSAVAMMRRTAASSTDQQSLHGLKQPLPQNVEVLAQTKTDAYAHAPAQTGHTLVVSGQVLGPEGKPVAGARLYWPDVRRKESPPRTRELGLVGRADEQGRFHVNIPRQDERFSFRASLVAAADGFGIDWVEPFRDGPAADVTLHLVKDQPIRGRILNTEGRPLAGVRLSVRRVEATNDEKLDRVLKLWQARGRIDFFEYLEKQEYSALDNALPLALTGRDGCCEIRGVGAERIALIVPSGPGVGQTYFYVVTKPNIDFTAYDRALWKNAAPYLRLAENWLPHLRGPTFDYVAAPAREITGTVRDAVTGKPLAGVTVATNSAGDRNSVRVVTDRRGHYRLTGLPPCEDYSLFAVPAAETMLLSRAADVRAPQGLGPVVRDIDLLRGVRISGQVIDASTRKGIPASVDFRPAKYFNQFTERALEKSGMLTRPCNTDEAGHYRLIVFPAPGLLSATPQSNPLLGDEKIAGIAMNPYLGDASRLFEQPPADGGSYELSVQRGRSLPLDIQDMDGKPLSGAMINGIDAGNWGMVPVPRSTCTLYALAPGKARDIVAYHPGRALAGVVVLRGDETKRVVVKLKVMAGITGRVLDSSGRPMSGVQVAVWPRDDRFSEIYGYVSQQHGPVRTDIDGRFVLMKIVPEQEIRVMFGEDGKRRVPVVPLAPTKVASGETLDLGDIRTKPR